MKNVLNGPIIKSSYAENIENYSGSSRFNGMVKMNWSLSEVLLYIN